MLIRGRDWKKIPLLMESLKSMLEGLTDTELEICKNIAIQEEKKCSDRHEKKEETVTHTKP
jgi:hypothetical protein